MGNKQSYAAPLGHYCIRHLQCSLTKLFSFGHYCKRNQLGHSQWDSTVEGTVEPIATAANCCRNLFSIRMRDRKKGYECSQSSSSSSSSSQQSKFMLFLATRPSLTPHWKHNRNVAPRPEAETETESNDTSYQTQREGEEGAERRRRSSIPCATFARLRPDLSQER